MTMSRPHTANIATGDMEVQFANRQESLFPHLMRLCMDFNFRVVKSKPTSPEHYCLTARDHDQSRAITPAFAQLEQLEQHVHSHMVDILHEYVFGLPEELATTH